MSEASCRSALVRLPLGHATGVVGLTRLADLDEELRRQGDHCGGRTVPLKLPPPAGPQMRTERGHVLRLRALRNLWMSAAACEHALVQEMPSAFAANLDHHIASLHRQSCKPGSDAHP